MYPGDGAWMDVMLDETQLPGVKKIAILAANYNLRVFCFKCFPMTA